MTPVSISCCRSGAGAATAARRILRAARSRRSRGPRDLLAQTKHLNVFGTVHAPLIQPIFAAKQFVTADYVGRGRFGLNLVCGWNQDEFNMFGVAQREHDHRYAYGRSWLDIVKRVMSSSEEFDVDDEFFHMRGVIGDPKPYGGSRPVVMNAGASPVGREFGVANCDLIFTPLVDLASGAELVRAAKARAAELNKDVAVACNGFVVCRPDPSRSGGLLASLRRR